MKWMIASDIHGSAHFCRLLLENFERERADRLLLLGDLLYHGPRNDLPRGYDTRETARRLNEYRYKISAVRGNCDAEVDQMVLQFPIMADYAVLEIDGRTIYATHGHIYNENNLPPLPKGDILLHGHTHVPKCAIHEDYICMNPGSVSLPKEDTHHGYMILENGKFFWKDISGENVGKYHE